MKNLLLISVLLFSACMSEEEKKTSLLLEGNEALGIGFHKAALQRYQDALKIDSCYADAFNNIGVLYAERNSTTTAIDYYSKAISCDQNFIPAYLNRAKLLYESNQLFMSLEDLQVVDALRPDSAYVIFSIGLVNTRLRDFSEALQNFDKAFSLDSANPEPLVNRATVWYYLNDLEKASRDFHLARQLFPKEAEVWNGLSMIDIRREQLDSALYKANKALEIQPTEAYYLNNRGYVHLLMGNMEAGLTDINESIAYNSDNSWAYRNKGWYYFLTAEYEDALRLLNQAYTMDPFTEHIGRMIGETYLAIDDKEQACEWFAIALKNNESGASALKKKYCDE